MIVFLLKLYATAVFTWQLWTGRRPPAREAATPAEVDRVMRELIMRRGEDEGSYDLGWRLSGEGGAAHESWWGTSLTAAMVWPTVFAASYYRPFYVPDSTSLLLVEAHGRANQELSPRASDVRP